MIDRHWDGIAAYCRPENKVSLGFVEGLNNKIRVFQRRAYGLKDEEYLRLKVLSCMTMGFLRLGVSPESRMMRYGPSRQETAPAVGRVFVPGVPRGLGHSRGVW